MKNFYKNEKTPIKMKNSIKNKIKIKMKSFHKTKITI